VGDKNIWFNTSNLRRGVAFSSTTRCQPSECIQYGSLSPSKEPAADALLDEQAVHAWLSKVQNDTSSS
jgi:hypothetical protein